VREKQTSHARDLLPASAPEALRSNQNASLAWVKKLISFSLHIIMENRRKEKTKEKRDKSLLSPITIKHQIE
jgi:hypothetical protein